MTHASCPNRCGACLAADDARILAHEARQPIPVPPSGPMVDLGRVIALLAQALEDHDRAARRRARDVNRPSTGAQQALSTGTPQICTGSFDATALSCNGSRTRPGEAA